MSSSAQFHQTIILGAGPSGLQLGYFCEKSGMDYLILEGSDSPGHFFKKFPRHRMLISINKRFTGYDDPEINLRWDWNSLLSDDPDLKFGNYDKDYFPKADALVQYLKDFAEKTQLNIAYNAKISEISRDPKTGHFSLKCGTQTYECKALIIATGLSKPYIPDIPGIEHTVNYTEMDTNPESYENKRVLILGKGNSAFETADSLVGATATIHVASPEPVKFAWQTHFVGHLRAVNNNILDTYHLKSQNAILNADIKKIEKKKDEYKVTFKYKFAEGECETLTYDKIICCTGFRFDTSIFEAKSMPDRTDCKKLPLMTAEWESTNLPNMFFCGNLMQSRDYKKTTSAFIHGFRYNARILYHILRKKYFNEALPGEQSDQATPQAVCDAILSRINRSSALWQQPGFIVDMILLNSDGFKYVKEVPSKLPAECVYNEDKPYIMVSLEYGEEKVADPFNPPERVHKENYDNAQASRFLHPIIRHYSASHELLSTHHVIEDLEGQWIEPEHTEPLLRYLSRVLPMPKSAGNHVIKVRREALKKKKRSRQGEVVR